MDWNQFWVVGIIALIMGGISGVAIFPREVEVEKEIEVIKEVPVNVTVEVPVDNGNLDVVLEHIYDNDGNVNYLTEDLDDDELSQVVDRVVFINEIKDLAVAEVKAEAADELDKEELIYFDADLDKRVTVTFDEDDIERIRVQDDDDEVIVDDVDFEDNDAEVIVTVNFEQDDVKFVADFMVEFKDGEVDDLDLLEIRER